MIRGGSLRVDPRLVRVLADMVDAALRRDGVDVEDGVESAPKATARNGGSPA